MPVSDGAIGAGGVPPVESRSVPGRAPLAPEHRDILAALLGDPDVEVSDAEFLVQGWTNLNYRVSVAGQDLALRICAVPHACIEPEVAMRRRDEPGHLVKTLRGDLDWIIMRALEKDRTRRYETADAFAVDIERYLNDEPVSASPPSTLYRIRKMIRRNRGAVAAACVVVVVLSLGVIGTSGGNRRA